MSWKYGLIRDMEKPENVIVSSENAVVIQDKYPKSKHHYLVLPIADIESIFKLNRSHLPLLKELHILAQKAVKFKKQLWEDFNVGFHAEPSLQRLHLHVISKDFISTCMKTKKHWNCHNTDLFVPFEKLYNQLKKDDCISRLPKTIIDKLLAAPLRCNQCDFVPDSLLDLKAHLFYHWHCKEEDQQQEQIDSKMKLSNGNNSSFNNQAKNHYQSENCRPRRPFYYKGPRAPMHGSRFAPNPHQNHFRQPGQYVFPAPPSINQLGLLRYPNQAVVGGASRPNWIPKYVLNKSQPNTKQPQQENFNPRNSRLNQQQQDWLYFQKLTAKNPDQPKQHYKQSNRSKTNQQNRQKPDQQNDENFQKPNEPKTNINPLDSALNSNPSQYTRPKNNQNSNRRNKKPANKKMKPISIKMVEIKESKALPPATKSVKIDEAKKCQVPAPSPKSVDILDAKESQNPPLSTISVQILEVKKSQDSPPLTIENQLASLTIVSPSETVS
ncbi:aprataxin-like protein [Drosophila eugracilis]|uniref:aprataxin-like protein n=1 Tax=Drosophila eugracilis TaxID=29029 RepID=UPI001BDAFBD6|nr:aprataxin-like protein [Drosophila eugracilis]